MGWAGMCKYKDVLNEINFGNHRWWWAAGRPGGAKAAEEEKKRKKVWESRKIGEMLREAESLNNFEFLLW